MYAVSHDGYSRILSSMFTFAQTQRQNFQMTRENHIYLVIAVKLLSFVMFWTCIFGFGVLQFKLNTWIHSPGNEFLLIQDLW